MLQLPLFPTVTAKFPSTRYQGSKAKLVEWIWSHIRHLEFTTCLDAFGGTGAVAYRLKQEGKRVVYNDRLRFNQQIGKALIENDFVRLDSERLEWLLERHVEIAYPSFVQDTFEGIYFTAEENAWIDQTITNIRHLDQPYQTEIAFFALCQACIIKRPYNLFHRKNLYIRLADVQRSFGNKATWDRPFEEWFRFFVEEANQAVFQGSYPCLAVQEDACAVEGDFDLVYCDPPYVSHSGVAVDYLDFYHFLEGLADYDHWQARIDRRSKHLRLKSEASGWTDKKRIADSFDALFRRYRDSILVVSYRSDGIPSEAALIDLLRQYKAKVRVERYGRYQYVLSKNARSEELVLIGSD